MDYGTAILQHCTCLLLTCMPLEDWLLEIWHSTKNIHKLPSTKFPHKLSLDKPSMKFYSVNTLREGGFKQSINYMHIKHYYILHYTYIILTRINKNLKSE